MTAGLGWCGMHTPADCGELNWGGMTPPLRGINNFRCKKSPSTLFFLVFQNRHLFALTIAPGQILRYRLLTCCLVFKVPEVLECPFH